MNKLKKQKEIIDPTIGKRLKLRRMMLGISQQELSEAVNVSVKQIQKYENSTSPIAGSILLVLSKLLNTSIQYFVNPPKTNEIANEYIFQDSIDQSPIIAEEGEEYSLIIRDINNFEIEDDDMTTLIELLSARDKHDAKSKTLKLTRSTLASEM